MKSKKEIQAMLGKICSDDRLDSPPAQVDINAPLALIQVELEAKRTVLKWVLAD